MPHLTDLTGLASVASAATASLLLLPWVARLAKTYLVILLATVFVLLLVPFTPLPIAAYLRGMTGDLSITTLVLLGYALRGYWHGCVKVETKHSPALLLLIGLCALIFYPMALGVGAYDPYRLGYGNFQFVAVLLLLALVAWYLKFALIVLCISFATFAWAIGWYESNNLWDYLLDPLVSIYALVVMMIHALKTLLQRIRRNKNFHA